MKKILMTLLMLTCVLGLTACGGEVEKLKYNEDAISAQCEFIYTYYLSNEKITTDIIKNDPAALNLNDDGLDLIKDGIARNSQAVYGEKFPNNIVRTEGQVVINALDSWDNAQDEIGTVTKQPDFTDGKFELKSKELVATFPFEGTEHNGSVEFIFDKNLHITSITTNIDYDLSESMKKAGMNTAIGMGTVFVMLVVIMIIIYCFGIIPKILNAGEAKKNEKAKAEASVDNAISAIVEREESTDDTELVAVIAAAIAQYEGTSTDGFVVRSIRRIK